MPPVASAHRALSLGQALSRGLRFSSLRLPRAITGMSAHLWVDSSVTFFFLKITFLGKGGPFTQRHRH